MQHASSYNFKRDLNAPTTVSNGNGLHLLLGWDEVLRTFAVGSLLNKKQDKKRSKNQDWHWHDMANLRPSKRLLLDNIQKWG